MILSDARCRCYNREMTIKTGFTKSPAQDAERRGMLASAPCSRGARARHRPRRCEGGLELRRDGESFDSAQGVAFAPRLRMPANPHTLRTLARAAPHAPVSCRCRRPRFAAGRNRPERNPSINALTSQCRYMAGSGSRTGETADGRELAADRIAARSTGVPRYREGHIDLRGRRAHGSQQSPGGSRRTDDASQ
jgi:hypothetical protein